MAKKRITLPESFQELLETGDVDKLKKIYQKCEINAKPSRYGSNAFQMTPLPKEFAFWLKEQGGDINLPDHYGYTPIFRHASVYNGNIPLMIELGAHINITVRGTTPLHHAATYGRLEALISLLENGAYVNGAPADELGPCPTPLAMTLIQARVPLMEISAICEILLKYGAKITDEAKASVTNIGKRFESNKHAIINEEFLNNQQAALSKLYQLFQVAPVAEIQKHDGVSPIIITETNTRAQYRKLWEYLVPATGPAKTAQGEVIRIVGKIEYEILDNGARNWDSDFQKMLDVLPQYFKSGTPLSSRKLSIVDNLIKRLYKGRGDREVQMLVDYGVAWVMKNQEIIPIIPPAYQR